MRLYGRFLKLCEGEIMDKYGLRIKEIRERMAEDEIDMYLIDDADPYCSEYVDDYYKLRTYISGFTGSNGKLLITKDGAYLWTDGRYFTQAKIELKDNALLMEMGREGVPTLQDFIVDKGGSLGFDEDNINSKLIASIMDKAGAKGVNITVFSGLKYAREIVNKEEKVILNPKEVRILGDDLVDLPSKKKVERVREYIKKKNGDIYLSAKLDMNMFLTNLRGNDIKFNPVAFSYVVITTDDAYLYLYPESYKDNREEIIKYLADNGIKLLNMNNFKEEISIICNGRKVIASLDSISFGLWESLVKNADAKYIPEDNELEIFKAIKGEKEIGHMKKIYLKDSVILTRFIYKLLHSNIETMDEYDAMVMLDDMRLEDEDCYDLSFNTISAYGANAAMMHYECTKDNKANLQRKGMYLVDSGGQYNGGTTDVTRTIRLGDCTDDMIRHYTKTAMGMLRLQNSVFMKDSLGVNLDILSRMPLWEEGIDYKCGTGHGIGYMLNVHEGPHYISQKIRNTSQVSPIVPGMIVSDEPGVYLEGEYGIRIENILLCVEKQKNRGDTFYKFEPLTLVPLDGSLIDKKYMNSDDVKYYDEYQQLVFDALSPYLDAEEISWLKDYIKA